MATSDSDDFESADEEVEFRESSQRKIQTKWVPQQFSAIDSDTDDDNDYIVTTKNNSWSSEISDEKCIRKTAVSNVSSTSAQETDHTNTKSTVQSSKIDLINSQVKINETREEEKTLDECNSSLNKRHNNNNKIEMECVDQTNETYGDDKLPDNTKTIENKSSTRRQVRPQRQQKQRESNKLLGFGATKLGVKIPSEVPTESSTNQILTPANTKTNVPQLDKKERENIQECWEFNDDAATKILQHESLKCHENSWHKKKSNMSSDIDDELINDNVPDELKSDKKFKEIFNNDGWEDFVDEDKVINDFDSEKRGGKELITKPIDKISDEVANSGGSWSSWGSWGVTSLLNTAGVSVSTLTNHVTHGLSYLEESIGGSDPVQLTQPQLNKKIESEDKKFTPESQTGSFGLSNLISGVSSITKLVESTGTKVISSGLGTLETIGKKTMEVLQEGDPGLKKKRAFFMNEMDKPILSQILREAKEKAEVAEKGVEEKQQARKVHFETLFDDFQGLVHLEALEMLSKQSNMKIQQRLVTLDADEIISIQETLDEVKELCELGEEDDEENENDDLQERLKLACVDLGVEMLCEKLYQIWQEAKLYVSNAESSTISNKEIFQNAISTMAQFTAYSVERFHKTAELLLVKERRSTTNEVDALVQLTNILSGQIGSISTLYSKCLNNRMKKMENANDSVDITTIFLEATNASSYIQEAFRLLIPILQVGII